MKRKSENQQARNRIEWILIRLVVLASLSWSFVAQAQLFTWDDGSVNAFGGTASGDLLALNHFNTGGAPVMIDEIRVLWNPISSTVKPTVTLYSDPNGDGNPSDMAPLLIRPISIPPNVVILNNTSVQSYSIPATQVSGSFFVGAYLSDKELSFNPVIGVDLAYLGPNQSWIIENSTAGLLSLMNPIGTSTLSTRLDQFIAGNHMIEAHYVPVPEPSSRLVLIFGLLCFAVRVVARRSLTLMGDPFMDCRAIAHGHLDARGQPTVPSPCPIHQSTRV